MRPLFNDKSLRADLDYLRSVTDLLRVPDSISAEDSQIRNYLINKML